MTNHFTQAEAVTLAESLSFFDGEEIRHEDVHALCNEAVDAKLAKAGEPTQGEEINGNVLLQAIARGWCSEKNSSKIMDPIPALAIRDEVQKLFTHPQASEPAPSTELPGMWDTSDFLDGATDQPAPSTDSTCGRCYGTGVVSDGVLTHSEGGVEYSEPIKCVKDCPNCKPSLQSTALPDQRLCKFYGVETYPELVANMLRHIERLQAKLPPTRDEQPGKARFA